MDSRRQYRLAAPLKQPQRSDREYALLFLNMTESYTPEFPISYPWRNAPEPESHALVHLHAHESLEFGYCHTSSGILVVEGRVTPFSAGDIQVVTEGEMHMSRSATGHPSHWSYLWVDAARLLAETPGGIESVNLAVFSMKNCPSIFPRSKYGPICQALLQIVNELTNKEPGHQLVVRGLVIAFLGMLQRACKALPTKQDAPPRSGLGRIAPALHHIMNHYAQPIEIEELAHACSTSVRSLRRLFQEAVGHSPMHYLAHLRARIAAGLLAETDKPISLIAYEAGFESINAFNRQFRAALGATPSEWRRTHDLKK